MKSFLLPCFETNFFFTKKAFLASLVNLYHYEVFFTALSVYSCHLFDIIWHIPKSCQLIVIHQHLLIKESAQSFHNQELFWISECLKIGKLKWTSKTNIPTRDLKLPDYFCRVISDTESKNLQKELDFPQKEWTRTRQDFNKLCERIRTKWHFRSEPSSLP